MTMKPLNNQVPLLPPPAPRGPASAPPQGQPAKTAAPQDKAEVSHSHRSLRKNVARAAGILGGAYNAVTSVPEGIVEGLTSLHQPDAPLSVKKARLGLAATITHTLAGAALGTAVGGPVGLIVGAVTGYSMATVGNFLSGRAGVSDRFTAAIDENVAQGQKELKEDAPQWRRSLKAAVSGASEALREGWRSGKTGAEGTAAGAMDGLQFLLSDTPSQQPAPEMIGPMPEKGWLQSVAEGTMGAVCGAAGAMINAPGGIVHGALESTRKPEEPTELSRPLLLLTTNVGKLLPTALIGAAIGGPIGALAGTAVGLVSASLTTIIDGRNGLNRGIHHEVSQALENAHGAEADGSGYRLYYRAGKGMMVGGFAGLKEGWRLGSESGRQMVRELVDAPVKAAGEEPSEARKS